MKNNTTGKVISLIQYNLPRYWTRKSPVASRRPRLLVLPQQILLNSLTLSSPQPPLGTGRPHHGAPDGNVALPYRITQPSTPRTPATGAPPPQARPRCPALCRAPLLANWPAARGPVPVLGGGAAGAAVAAASPPRRTRHRGCCGVGSGGRRRLRALRFAPQRGTCVRRRRWLHRGKRGAAAPRSLHEPPAAAAVGDSARAPKLLPACHFGAALAFGRG